MNAYSKAMNHCMPPANLEQRLAQRVQVSASIANKRIIRPMTLARRVVLAAVLALALSISVGAAVLVNWDGIFADRFGEEAASLPVTQTAFQRVDVTSVCDDVTLTVRQALGDSKTIYLILDYRLPETVDRELVRRAWDEEDGLGSGLINVEYYATGDWDWEKLKASEADKWAEIDWTSHEDRSVYLRKNVLKDWKFIGGGGSLTGERGYDEKTGTLTYLLRFNTDSHNQTLQDQPLTLLVAPPTIIVGGVETPLADYPAIITFQPEYTAVARSGEARGENNDWFISAELSSFTISVSYYGSDYRTIEELQDALALVLEDGTVLPVRGLGEGFAGGQSDNSKFEKVRISYETHFKDILDAAAVTTIRVGNIEIPLTGEA